LPLTLSRTAALSESASGWNLRLDYAVTNIGVFALPWSWAAHPAFAAEAGDRIVLPASIHTLRLEGSGRSRLGKSGDRVNWPLAAMADGGETDLSVAAGPESWIGDKLFAGPLNSVENWCALERRKAGVRIKVSFDAVATPYLGLWICYGGWPERAGTKQQCVAMEPSTAPVDSLAMLGPWSRILQAGETFLWNMNVAIESIHGKSVN
jgi:galactose mutarotase-like enzyme